MIIAYITCKDDSQAVKITKKLISKRLIACANIFPVKSVYRWKKKIVNEREVVIIAKTLKKKFNDIKKEVKKIHSYDIPCIVMFEAKADKIFESWIKGEVK